VPVSSLAADPWPSSFDSWKRVRRWLPSCSPGAVSCPPPRAGPNRGVGLLRQLARRDGVVQGFARHSGVRRGRLRSPCVPGCKLRLDTGEWGKGRGGISSHTSSHAHEVGQLAVFLGCIFLFILTVPLGKCLKRSPLAAGLGAPPTTSWRPFRWALSRFTSTRTSPGCRTRRSSQPSASWQTSRLCQAPSKRFHATLKTPF
jgi:hypothetical protein